MFRDRLEAGSLLAGKLKKFYDQNGLVLAVPRGGIPVAYVVAKELGFPLDIILTKKIGHPVNREYAIGAVKKLAAEADEVVVVLIPETFYGVGAFYEDFHQVSDEEVMYYLDLFKNEIKRTA